MYFLDSDICINLMNGKLPETRKLMMDSDPRCFGIPAIVEAELRTGVAKSKQTMKNLMLLESFLAPFASIPFDAGCAVAYGRIRADLESRGSKIGPNDTLIAATAVASGAVLVTGNIREFSRVQGLQVQFWDEVAI